MVPFLRVIDRSYKGNTVVNLEKKNTIIFVPFFLFLQIVFLHLFIYYKLEVSLRNPIQIIVWHFGHGKNS